MASSGPRLTPQTVEVLRLLLTAPAVPRYGRDIARETKLKTGTLHPILARLELAGHQRPHELQIDFFMQGHCIEGGQSESCFVGHWLCAA